MLDLATLRNCNYDFYFHGLGYEILQKTKRLLKYRIYLDKKDVLLSKFTLVSINAFGKAPIHRLNLITYLLTLGNSCYN